MAAGDRFGLMPAHGTGRSRRGARRADDAVTRRGLGSGTRGGGRMMAEPRGGDGAEITALDARRARRACVRDRAGITVAWGVWGAMTLALFLQVRHYSRNVPFADDFAMVSVMTHSEPVSLRWAWSQHNEHRPMVSRLLLAGLSRYVANDFRTARYVNAGLLSVMAAMMLVLA